MKGIILAGGSGTRLYPLTRVLSKQLMPIYDKPMIYYPLGILLQAGIREIMVITTPHDLTLFQQTLGTGEDWGVSLQYTVQPEPNGIAQAMILAEDFLAGSSSCLILGDNFFYGQGLSGILKQASELKRGAHIWGYRVKSPGAYGVLEFDAQGQIIGLEEKPKHPKSKYAIPGIYFFDFLASERARSLRPSARNEFEITDLVRLYLQEGSLEVTLLDRGFAWLDTGTHEDLLKASQFIHTMIERQGLQIGCLEEIAYKRGYISKESLQNAAKKYGNSQYGAYLKELVAP